MWIEEDSCPDYSSRVEECLKQEKDRVSHYLHISSEQKLLEITGQQLSSLTANKSAVDKASCYPALFLALHPGKEAFHFLEFQFKNVMFSYAACEINLLVNLRKKDDFCFCGVCWGGAVEVGN
ncbi:hypothetical protein IFM89_004074 [Coptis chinensis]|uniref:Cullin N-terminal domain-containing protein n=1 Tax=Coptis chinensis TaxID=261450 RepID=A0A835H1P8_9MAGN|nr:hypothetical protein IFM89_004074 [Coptis chinensis]